MGTDNPEFQHDPLTWLSTGEISVDIDQLDDFSSHILDGIVKNFASSYETGIVPMLRVPGTFGVGGLNEGKMFRVAHQQSAQAVTALLGDVRKGLTMLGMAAKLIASEYKSGDAFAQATCDAVNAAFTPPPTPLGQTNAPTADPATSDYDRSKVPTDLTGQSTSAGNPYSPPTDPNAAQTIAAGTSGQHVIPADNELTGPSKSTSPGPQPAPSPGSSPTPPPSS